MIKLFERNQPFVLVLIPIMVLCHFTLDVFFPSFELLASGQENLWQLDFNLLSTLHSRIGAFILISLNAILVNRVFNTHEFYERNTFLPSLIYLLLVFLFPLSLRLQEDLLAHTFFILCLSKLFDIKQNDDARKSTFLSGLFLGCAVTFLPVYIYFLIFIWMGTLSIRPFVLREFLLPLFGVILPLGWVLFIDIDFYTNFITFDSHLDYSRFGELIIFIPHILVVALSFIGYRNILARRLKSSIRYKRIVGLTTYVFMFSVASASLVTLLSGSYFYFTIGAVVLSIILPYAYLDTKQKWLPTTLIYGLLVMNVLKFLY